MSLAPFTLIALIASLVSFSFTQPPHDTQNLNLNNTGFNVVNKSDISFNQLAEYVNRTITATNGSVKPLFIERFATENGTYRVNCKILLNYLALNSTEWVDKYTGASNIIIFNWGRTKEGDNVTKLCYLVNARNATEAECLVEQDRANEAAFPRIEKQIKANVKNLTRGGSLTESYCNSNSDSTSTTGLTVFLIIGFFFMVAMLAVGVFLHIQARKAPKWSPRVRPYIREQRIQKGTPEDDFELEKLMKNNDEKAVEKAEEEEKEEEETTVVEVQVDEIEAPVEAVASTSSAESATLPTRSAPKSAGNAQQKSF